MVDVAAPTIVQSNHDGFFIASIVMLSVLIGLAAMRFGFFMLHLRHVYQARLNATHGATQS